MIQDVSSTQKNMINMELRNHKHLQIYNHIANIIIAKYPTR